MHSLFFQSLATGDAKQAGMQQGVALYATVLFPFCQNASLLCLFCEVERCAQNMLCPMPFCGGMFSCLSKTDGNARHVFFEAWMEAMPLLLIDPNAKGR